MGWKDRNPETLDAAAEHKAVSPSCADGAYSVRTFQDSRTDPPTVEQVASCDVCHRNL